MPEAVKDVVGKGERYCELDGGGHGRGEIEIAERADEAGKVALAQRVGGADGNNAFKKEKKEKEMNIKGKLKRDETHRRS